MVGKQLIWKSGYMDEDPSLRPRIHPSLVGGTSPISAVEDRTGVPDHMWRTCKHALKNHAASNCL